MIFISLLYLACWCGYYRETDYTGTRYEFGCLLLMLAASAHVVLYLLAAALELIDI